MGCTDETDLRRLSFFNFDFISKYKCLVFSKAFFYGLFLVIKNRCKPVSSVKHVGQKKTLPFAKSKKCSVFKCNNLMNVSGNYAISVSREDFIDELIIDKVRGSDSPEKKASNTS